MEAASDATRSLKLAGLTLQGTLQGDTTGPSCNRYAFCEIALFPCSDRNSAITEGTKSVSYARDVTNRVVSRITNDGTTTTTTRYGFTGSGDTPDLAMDGSNNVTEKYLSLPGDMQLTIRPGHTDATAQTAWEGYRSVL